MVVAVTRFFCLLTQINMARMISCHRYFYYNMICQSFHLFYHTQEKDAPKGAPYHNRSYATGPEIYYHENRASRLLMFFPMMANSLPRMLYFFISSL